MMQMLVNRKRKMTEQASILLCPYNKSLFFDTNKSCHVSYHVISHNTISIMSYYRALFKPTFHNQSFSDSLDAFSGLVLPAPGEEGIVDVFPYLAVGFQ